MKFSVQRFQQIINKRLFVKINLAEFSSNKKYQINKDQLQKRLTRQQYYVTQLQGTQPPFRNQYYSENRRGSYRCIVCGQKLFSSQSKYDSGSGWPAFWEKQKTSNINQTTDNTHGMVRTEVSCGQCSSHLGHVFNDGPKDKTGLRYCINSSSLDFCRQQE